MNRLFRVALFLSVLAAAAPTWGAAPSTSGDQFVSVGGARLHFVVRPGHGPVVLFEAGGGETAEEWTKVMDLLAPRTGASLVAYDRERHGRSDPVTGPYDIFEEAARLHKGLVSFGLDHDVVLVGHSYGGFLIQVYANLYPSDVRAMVYVDANTVEGVGGIEGAHKLEAIVAAKGPPSGSEARMLPVFSATVEALQRNPAPCGIPITVISQGKGDLLPDEPHWFEGHKSLVRRTNARALVADGSGHMIADEAPDVVVEATLHALEGPRPSRAPWFIPADEPCDAAPAH
jgi:pimeloyl-ACP methyl ester carboxylesterase